MSVIDALSALASSGKDPASAADASAKLEYLKKAFQVEVRTKVPLFKEMRDALAAHDEGEYHRQANSVNAIAVFNNGVSFCTNDELLKLADLMQSVMEATTSVEQKEPIEKMQRILDQAQGRKVTPANGAEGLP